jgi:hypothetical protein
VDLSPAGTDVDSPDGEDIGAQFTASLDDGSCAYPTRWYYGLDANAPFGREDFATVVIHELAHGLGFQSFVTRTTGGKLTGNDGVARDDAFMVHLWDATAGKGWPEMTNAERLASITNTGGLVWNGPAVVAVAGSVLSAGVGPGGRVQMYAPNPSEKGSSVSHWDTAVSPSEAMEPYYTGPKHELLVTGELMSDLGWSLASGSPVYTWLLPSSAKTGGAFGAVWTTTLYLGNRGSADARYRLKFLGNNADGTAGPETPELVLPSNQTITYEDVLGTVFSKGTGSYGAIRVTADVPTLSVLASTTTPVPPAWSACVSSGGYGLSIPAYQASDMITAGTVRSIVGIRNDGAYRTNLVLANAGTSEVVVTGTLRASGGAVLGTKSWPLPPLGMTQGSDTLAGQMGITGSFRDAQLLLTTSTPGGSFAAYATIIDNATNDARTLLPR